MIWDFKQRLFVSQRKVSYQAIADLSNPAVRERLQNHIDESGRLPSGGAPDEYATLFERVFPAESDRRAYLDGKLAGAKPSFGHIGLATLMRSRLTRLVWTTNFDSLVADACATIFGTTSSLSSVALDAPDLAAELIKEERWPVEVKLHGDFRSCRLKNTTDELRLQDARLRKLLVETCKRFGLIVVGYSGRDDSVMSALEEAVNQPGSFPHGLFWLHREAEDPLPRVSQLILRAVETGAESALVRIDNFDEAVRDLLRLMQGLDTTELVKFEADRRRCTAAPRLTGTKTWPVLRLNALLVLQMPSSCRRVVCDVGGYKEVHDAIEAAGLNVIASRVHAGVLAFGSDADVRAVFEAHGIRDFDLHAIEPRRLRYDSGERGLGVVPAVVEK